MQDSNKTIFDKFRRKYVAATPEELVRQAFCNFLVEQLAYPLTSIANEVSININGQKQRCDTLIYKNSEPIMLIEYKSDNITISQSTFDQVLRYNSKLKVPYIVVCNSKQVYCCKIDLANITYSFLENIPMYINL